MTRTHLSFVAVLASSAICAAASVAHAQEPTATLELLGGVPGARALVDGSDRGTLPLAAPLVLAPGPHRIEVVADGFYPVVRDVTLSPGGRARETFVLTPRTEVPAIAQGSAPPISTPCPDGRSVGPDTNGHCCWPAQAWSRTQNACIGRPECVAPLRASGGECVTGAAARARGSARVSFGGWEDGSASQPIYEIRVIQRGRVAECATPCTLDLEPGVAHVHTEGAATLDEDLLVPPAGGHVELWSAEIGLWIFGAISLVLGGGSAVPFFLIDADRGPHDDMSAGQILLLTGVILGGLGTFSSLAVAVLYAAVKSRRISSGLEFVTPDGPGARVAPMLSPSVAGLAVAGGF